MMGASNAGARRVTWVRCVGVLGLLLGVGSGCGGAISKVPVQKSMPMDPATARAEVAAERERIMLLRTQDDGGAMTSPQNVESSSSGAGADSAASGPCQTTCRAAKGICTSSERICTISASHPRESDFQEACVWASGECANAREVCRACKGL